MHFFGGSHMFQREISRRAQEQEDIIRVLLLFPMNATYKAHPTDEQFVSFCYDAGAAGYSLKSLYEIFASGKIPAELDALIRKHAEGWRPSGEIVESEL